VDRRFAALARDFVLVRFDTRNGTRRSPRLGWVRRNEAHLVVLGPDGRELARVEHIGARRPADRARQVARVVRAMERVRSGGPRPRAGPRRRPRDGASSAPAVVTQALEAHGGLETWRDRERATFVLSVRRPDEAPRRVRIAFPTSGALDVEATLGERAATYHDGRARVRGPDGRPLGDRAAVAEAEYTLPTLHYLWSLPWKLVDDGVVLDRAEDRRVDGRLQQGVRVTFEPDTGLVPEDWYVWYFDAETGRMRSVWFREHHPGHEAVLWIDFEGEVAAGGLVLPRRWVFRRGDPAGRRHEVLKIVEVLAVSFARP